MGASGGVSAPPAVGAAVEAAVPAQEDVVLNLAGGRVVIDLFEKECPAHAERFKSLVRSGYYEGLSFNRACWGFAQVGKPQRPEAVKPVRAEIRQQHVRGAVAAVRQPDQGNPTRESYGSLFFIMKQPYPDWDGQYTVFGRVVEGMELIDRIPDGNKADDYYHPQGQGEKILNARLVPAPKR